MVGVGVVPRGWLSRRACRRLGVGRIPWYRSLPCETGEIPWCLSCWAIWRLPGFLDVGFGCCGQRCDAGNQVLSPFAC